MIIRRESLAALMSRYLIDQIKKTPNIEVWPQTSISEVHGEQHLEEISVHCSTTPTTDASRRRVFSFISAPLPSTDWLGSLVQRDARGFILSGPRSPARRQTPARLEHRSRSLASRIQRPGDFVVGDVRHGSVKRALPA